MGKLWTDEELEKLKILYSKTDKRSLEKIFNMNYCAIEAKALRLGLHKENQRKPWSEEDITKLKKIYVNNFKEFILDQFSNKTWRAIREKAIGLKLFRDPELIKKDNINNTKKGNLEKFGVEFSWQREDIKDNIRQKHLEKRGVEYPTQDPSVIAKSRESFKKKYNVGWISQSEEIKQAKKITCLENFGTENPMQNDEVKERATKTNLNLYGVENVFQSEAIKQKSRETLIKNCGYDNPQKCPEVRERTQQTNIDRYGFPSPAQNEGVRLKTENTNLEKFGFKTTFQNEEVKQKTKDTLYKRYKCLNSSQIPGITDKIRATNIKKYGVDHLMKDPKEALKRAKKCNNAYIRYHWKTGEEIVCVGSYEMLTVEYLNLNKINYEWQPFAFTLSKGNTYRPDVFFPETNLWVEIKGRFYEDAMEKWEEFHRDIKPNSELWDYKKLKEMGLFRKKRND